MKLKPNVVAAAVALFAAGVANAALTPGTPSPGNSSMMFVAADTTPRASDGSYNMSLTIDLGELFADFVGGPLTFANGALTAPGTTVSWNFNTNTRTTNGVVDGGNFQWSTAYTAFKNTIAGIAGDSIVWGVIANDNNGTGAPSGTNVASNKNVLLTPTAALTGITSSNVSTAAVNTDAFLVANNGTGTHVAGATGAATATAGDSFLGSILNQDFGGQLDRKSVV